METVFNHNITEEEWMVIHSLPKELYLSTINEEEANYDLAFLFFLRGQKEKVHKYVAKLSPLRKNNFWRVIASLRFTAYSIY